jgi:hypothetical protein
MSGIAVVPLTGTILISNPGGAVTPSLRGADAGVDGFEMALLVPPKEIVLSGWLSGIASCEPAAFSGGVGAVSGDGNAVDLKRDLRRTNPGWAVLSLKRFERIPIRPLDVFRGNAENFL